MVTERERVYQREYMRQRRAKLKEEKMSSTDNFQVPTANIGSPDKTLDLDSKKISRLLKMAEESQKKKSEEMGDDDKFLKYMSKAVEYAPMVQEVVKNLVAGFNTAALNSQQARAQPQQNTLRAPDGWEHMSGLQRLGRKYSMPEWYAAGEHYETMKATGGAQYVTPVNTSYVDPNYRQPPQEPRNLRELRNKYPEPPVVNDNSTAQMEDVENSNTQSKPSFVKKIQENKEVTTPDPNVELLNAMREDNTKYINLAFNYLSVMDMKQFIEYVEDIESFKPKFVMLNALLPIQTREMLKLTSSDELVEIFSEKCPDKYKWLKENNKLPEIKSLFEELKVMLQ